MIRPSIAPIQNSANPVGADVVLNYMFQNQGTLFWWTFNFLPSGLYAGGDPTGIPADLRPYFNLRAEQVMVSPGSGGCSKGRLQVTGGGVTVIGAKATGGQCKVTVDVSVGQTGVRDLDVMGKASGRAAPAVAQTMKGAVDLTNAIPVVPAFLK